jgi:hypothetical protein
MPPAGPVVKASTVPLGMGSVLVVVVLGVVVEVDVVLVSTVVDVVDATVVDVVLEVEVVVLVTVVVGSTTVELVVFDGQAEKSIVQFGLQIRNAPVELPGQVAVPKSLVSHSSPGSIVPLPQSGLIVVVVLVLVVVVVGRTVVDVVDATVVDVVEARVVDVVDATVVDVVEARVVDVVEARVVVVDGVIVVDVVDGATVVEVVDGVIVVDVVDDASVVDVVDATVVDVVLEVEVLVLVTVVDGGAVVVVVGTGHASPEGRGLQTNLSLSESLRAGVPSALFFLTEAERFRLAAPSLKPFLVSLIGVTNSTCAPQAEPVSSCEASMLILPPAPFTPFTLPLPFAWSSAAGGVQPVTPGWLMQTPTSNRQDPFAVVTPSLSHAGSQSVHSRTCFLPSSVTWLASMPS